MSGEAGSERGGGGLPWRQVSGSGIFQAYFVLFYGVVKKMLSS